MRSDRPTLRRFRASALLAASLLLPVCAGADPYGFAALFAPVAHHRFTAPATLRLFAMGRDHESPNGWDAVKMEFLLDGQVAATETVAEYANFQTTIGGVLAGTHVLRARSYDHDGDVHESEDVTVFVDPPLPDGPVFDLAGDIVLSGSAGLVIAGTADHPAKVIGNGHQIVSSPGWTGVLTIRHAELRGLGATGLRALDVRAAGSGAVMIEDSLFERTGVVEVGADDQAQVSVRRNTFSSNMLMILTQQPWDCDPAVRLRGDSTSLKLFQGNRVGIGWAEFLNTRDWLVGGDTDAETNVVIAARGGIQALGSQGMVMRGNFSTSRYLGGWSQGLNFELPGSAGILVEHNVIRGSSWPVRSLDGEFRYNLVTNPGHSWLQHPAAAADIHHNVLLSESENETGQGLWVLYGNQDIRFANNTVDAGAPAVDWFGHGVNVSDGSAIVRSNAFTRFPASSPANPVVNGADGDYNLFFSPESADPRNYESGGAGVHDAGGGVPDAQVDPVFAGPRPIPVPIAEEAVWERTLLVSQILGLFRDAYEPAAGSPLTDAGDPAGDPGNDIGAVGSGAPSPLDRFGHFPVTLPSADLSVTKSDQQATAVPGQPVTYTIGVSNAGPSPVAGATVLDTLPAVLTNASWTCSASPGSSCTGAGAGSIADSVSVLAGGELTYTLTATVDAAATGSVSNTVSVSAPAGTSDPAAANDSATDVDALVPPGSPPAEGELLHGYDARLDLADLPGPLADSDLFRVYQRPHASYEAVLDGASGDLAPGIALDRLASDGSSVLQPSVPGAGASRSLRWIHYGDLPSAEEYVRVGGNGCPGSCDAQDVYRLRFYETTGFVARFNNSATQVSVLLLQNLGEAALDLDVRFWGQGGAPLGGQLLALGPRQTAAINTAVIVPGQGGSISIGHTGRHGQLAGKAVAVEPGTGFTFDTPLAPRPR